MPAVLLTILVSLVFALTRNPEPRYAGHSLSYWLEAPDSPQAQAAIRAIGTNAIPHLLSLITYEPPEWKTRVGHLLPVLSESDEFWRLLYGTANARGMRGFQVLGTNAVPALPALVQMMNDRRDRHISVMAAWALARLGTQAIPYLNDALSNTNYFGRPIIPLAVSEMPHFGVPTNMCLPLILKATTNADFDVRLFATNALSRLQPDSPPQ